MAIEVKELTKIIGNSDVLFNITITADAGKITGLCGVNGSGKTMLLRAIAGLIKPTSGIIEVNGKRLWRDSGFPESIGILIEQPGFLNRYSGFRNLELIASVKREIGRDQIRDAMITVGLDPDEKKKYKKYSLGMKQRLGIAAAIMERPQIVLFDEPTNALDEDGIEVFKHIAIEEKKRGATVVMSCHDKQILRELSDEIYYIESGKIIDHETR